MHLNSLLLVAGLFVCLHTSSTRSMSTSVGHVRSNKVSSCANPIEMETITEERAFNFPAVDQIIQGVSLMASKVAEIKLYLSLRARGKNGMEAYEFLQLHNADSIKLRNIRLKAWARYLQKFPEITEEATRKVLTRFGDESVVKIIDALKEAKVREEILGDFKDKLIKYWRNEKKSSLDVWNLLKLDKVGSWYSPIELERFQMWIKFSTDNYRVRIVDVCNNFKFDVRNNIIVGLQQLGDKENWKSMEAALIKYINQPHNHESFRKLTTI